MGRVGVFGQAGRRADGLLEDQHVADLQRKLRGVVERGARGAFGKTAVLVIPGVEADAVVGAVQGQVVQGFEDGRCLLLQDLGVIRWRDDSSSRLAAGQQRCAGRQGIAVSGRARLHVEVNPSAGVAAVVHAVVEQAGVAAQRDALAGGAEVGLGGNRVLVVAQLVTQVGHRLHQGYLHVGRVALLPVRHDRGQPVEHQAAEAAVVLGQVVDQRGGQVLGRALVDRRAVEIAVAVDLEGEAQAGKLRVEAVRRVGLALPGHQAQDVGRVVAARAGLQGDNVVRGGGDLDGDALDAHPAFDDEVAVRQGRRGGKAGRLAGQAVNEMHLQRHLVGRDHLQVVHAVQHRAAVHIGGVVDDLAPLFVAAIVLSGHLYTCRSNWAVWDCCVRRMV